MWGDPLLVIAAVLGVLLLVASIYLFSAARNTARQARDLGQTPREGRPGLVESVLGTRLRAASGLTAEQQHVLARTTLARRARRFRVSGLVSVGVVALTALTSFYALIGARPEHARPGGA